MPATHLATIVSDGRQRRSPSIDAGDRRWRRPSYTERRSLVTPSLRLPWIFMNRHVAHIVIMWSVANKISTRLAVNVTCNNQWAQIRRKKEFDRRLKTGCYAGLVSIPVIQSIENRFTRRLQEIFTHGCKDLWIPVSGRNTCLRL